MLDEVLNCRSGVLGIRIHLLLHGPLLMQPSCFAALCHWASPSQAVCVHVMCWPSLHHLHLQASYMPSPGATTLATLSLMARLTKKQANAQV
jgi:hypothetical protein